MFKITEETDLVKDLKLRDDQLESTYKKLKWELNHIEEGSPRWAHEGSDNIQDYEIPQAFLCLMDEQSIRVLIDKIEKKLNSLRRKGNK